MKKELFSLRSREDLSEGSPNHESILLAWDSVLFAYIADSEVTVSFLAEKGHTTQKQDFFFSVTNSLFK